MGESPDSESLHARPSPDEERAGSSPDRPASSTTEAAAAERFKDAVRAGDTAAGAAIRVKLLVQILETGRPVAMRGSYVNLMLGEEDLLRRLSDHERTSGEEA